MGITLAIVPSRIVFEGGRRDATPLRASMRLFAAALLSCVSASPLWDYVHRDDGMFAWRDTGKTLQGGTKGAKGSWTG